eukprot:TRINITY_DN17882_c0_g1_i1.p1 TRINITY_DN17882_c0_g1~~TRINITY_DN17882_c0_g1_i1.p1  ORF type:complete len:607 (+),score=81.86 TRINITY_DN17882_c0_g1_i1:33-1853(+)
MRLGGQGQPKAKDGSCMAVRIAGRRGRVCRDDVVVLYDGSAGCLWTWSAGQGWVAVKGQGPKLVTGFGLAYSDDAVWLGGCSGEDGGYLYQTDLSLRTGWTQLCELGCTEGTIRLHVVRKRLVATVGPDQCLVFSTQEQRMIGMVPADPSPRSGDGGLPVVRYNEGYSTVGYGDTSLVAFGGHVPGGSQCTNDVYMLHRGAMVLQCCGGSMPTPRSHHAADIIDATMLVIGGCESSGATALSAHSLHLPSLTWRRVVIPGTYPQVSRWGHVVCFLAVPYGVLQVDHHGATYVPADAKRRPATSRPARRREQNLRPARPPTPPRKDAQVQSRPRVWSSGGLRAAPQLFSTPTRPLYREVDLEVEKRDGKAPPYLGVRRIPGELVDSMVTRLNSTSASARSRTEDEYRYLLDGGEVKTLSAEAERRHVDRMYYHEVEVQHIRRDELKQKWAPPQKRCRKKEDDIAAHVASLCPEHYPRVPNPPRRAVPDTEETKSLYHRLYETDIKDRRARRRAATHRTYYSKGIEHVGGGYGGLCIYDSEHTGDAAVLPDEELVPMENSAVLPVSRSPQTAEALPLDVSESQRKGFFQALYSATAGGGGSPPVSGGL